MRKFGAWYMRNFGLYSGRAHDLGTVIIGVAIGLFILAAILPTAITNLSTANVSGWAASTVTIWNLMPVVVIAGVILLVYGYIKTKKANG